MAPTVSPDIILKPGDLVLSLTDGYTDNLSPDEVIAIANTSKSPQEIHDKMQTAALEKMATFEKARIGLAVLKSMAIASARQLARDPSNSYAPFNELGYVGCSVDKKGELVGPDFRPLPRIIKLDKPGSYYMDEAGNVYKGQMSDILGPDRIKFLVDHYKPDNLTVGIYQEPFNATAQTLNPTFKIAGGEHFFQMTPATSDQKGQTNIGVVKNISADGQKFSVEYTDTKGAIKTREFEKGRQAIPALNSLVEILQTVGGGAGVKPKKSAGGALVLAQFKIAYEFFAHLIGSNPFDASFAMETGTRKVFEPIDPKGADALEPQWMAMAGKGGSKRGWRDFFDSLAILRSSKPKSRPRSENPTQEAMIISPFSAKERRKIPERSRVSSVAKKVLDNPLTAPNTIVEIEGRRFYFSRPLQDSTNRKYYTVLYETTDGFEAFFFYYSKSGGDWRFSTNFANGIIDKGPTYTQGNNAAEAIIPYLIGAQNKGPLHIEKELLPVMFNKADMGDRTVFAAVEDRAKPYEAPELEGLKTYRQGVMFSGGRNAGKKSPTFKEFNDITAALPRDFIPNTNESPISVRDDVHLELGPIKVYRFESGLHGKKVHWDWAVANDGYGFLKACNFADTRINRFGGLDISLNIGFLAAKPLEYRELMIAITRNPQHEFYPYLFNSPTDPIYVDQRGIFAQTDFYQLFYASPFIKYPNGNPGLKRDAQIPKESIPAIKKEPVQKPIAPALPAHKAPAKRAPDLPIIPPKMNGPKTTRHKEALRGLVPNTADAPRKVVVSEKTESDADIVLGTHPGEADKKINKAGFVQGDFINPTTGDKEYWFVVLDGTSEHSLGVEATEVLGRSINREMDNNGDLVSSFNLAEQSLSLEDLYFRQRAQFPASVAAGVHIKKTQSGETIAKIVHVGDAAVWILRKQSNGEYTLIYETEDQSFSPNISHASNLEKRAASQTSKAFNALGLDTGIAPTESADIRLNPRDLVLSLNKGYTANLSPDEVITIANSSKSPKEIHDKMQTAALEKMAAFESARKELAILKSRVRGLSRSALDDPSHQNVSFNEHGYQRCSIDSSGNILSPDLRSLPFVIKLDKTGDFYMDDMGNVYEGEMSAILGPNRMGFLVDHYEPGSLTAGIYQEP